jgi:hypothetical protein
MEEDLAYLKERIEKVRHRLDLLVKQDYADQLTVLKSIPGIGERTAIYLLLMTPVTYERSERMTSPSSRMPANWSAMRAYRPPYASRAAVSLPPTNEVRERGWHF